MSELEKKKQLLEEYVIGNMLFIYKDFVDEGDKLTQEETIQLYEECSNSDKMKFVLYSFMSEEEQMKRIDDIQYFEVFDKSIVSELRSGAVYDKIMDRYVALNMITPSNMASYFVWVNDNNMLLKAKMILCSIKNNKSETRKINYMQAEELSVEYRYQLYKSILDNVKLNNANEVVDLISGIHNIGDKEKTMQLLCELVTKEEFAVRDSVWKKVNSLLGPLELEDRLFMIDYMLKVKTNENYLYPETAIAWMIPAEEIIKLLESRPEIDYETVAINLAKDQWNGLYEMFLNSPKYYKKYITPDFVVAGCDALEESELETVLIEDLIKNENFDLRTKYQTICWLDVSDESKLAIVDVMIEILGNQAIEYITDLAHTLKETCDIEGYSNIKNALIEKCGIKNKENLEKYFKKFGTAGIKGFESPNLVNLINLDNQDYDKIMKLFSDNNRNVNMDVINAVINSFLQRQFKLDRSEIYNIFSKFENLLQSKTTSNIDEVRKGLDGIRAVIGIPRSVEEREELIENLFAHKKEALDELHKITDSYIAKEREKYSGNKMNAAYDMLNVEKYYNKSYIKKNYFILRDESDIIDDLYDFYKDESLNEEEKNLILDEKILKNIIDFKKGIAKESRSASFFEKVNMMDGILNKMYSKRKLKLSPEPLDAKYDYIIPSPKDDDLIEVLAGLDPVHISNYLNNNEDLYGRLNRFLNKYKFAGWGNIFSKNAIEADVEVDASMTYSLINYFDKIEKMMANLPPKNQTLTALLDCINVYSRPSEKYQALINKENIDYIARNPGPNQSSSPKSVRINEIQKHVNHMFSRNNITVPSGEKTIKLNNGVEFKVSIGDIYDPIALTYGERTGACLRIKGAFYDLFEYCLKDKNGFHIRFNDPKTGEFISRVSGIRNGNTVFLNELRESVSEHYSSEDLVEALKQIAQFLVESTKNDPHPIENVVVSNDYAMKEQESYELNIESTKKAFNNLSFNITSKGYILYTSSENHKTLMPYKFGDEYVSEYKPYNTKIEVAKPEDVKMTINNVHILNETMKGLPMSDIEMLEVENVKQCIYGHGWVVYLDDKNKLHKMVIDKFKDDKRLQEMIENATKTYFGGVLNENIR